ncbi:hypothetical protein AB9F35_34845, partial [Rhizobium leguminosarum]
EGIEPEIPAVFVELQIAARSLQVFVYARRAAHAPKRIDKLRRGPPKTCQRSAIVDVADDLTDFNVNQNAWISSMLLYKMGLFGI